MANKSIFLVLLLVTPLLASAETVLPSCSVTTFTRYNVAICLPGGQNYFAAPPAGAQVAPRTLPAGWLSSWRISSGLLSAQPVWTNEETDGAVANEFINFGLSQCINSTRRAAAVSGGCICDTANDLVLSKPAFLNVTAGTVDACGIGNVRQGVRPVSCNSWLCGCVSPDRAQDAGAVVSQAYCN